MHRHPKAPASATGPASSSSTRGASASTTGGARRSPVRAASVVSGRVSGGGGSAGGGRRLGVLPVRSGLGLGVGLGLGDPTGAAVGSGVAEGRGCRPPTGPRSLAGEHRGRQTLAEDLGQQVAVSASLAPPPARGRARWWRPASMRWPRVGAPDLADRCRARSSVVSSSAWCSGLGECRREVVDRAGDRVEGVAQAVRSLPRAGPLAVARSRPVRGGAHGAAATAGIAPASASRAEIPAEIAGSLSPHPSPACVCRHRSAILYGQCGRETQAFPRKVAIRYRLVIRERSVVSSCPVRSYAPAAPQSTDTSSSASLISIGQHQVLGLERPGELGVGTGADDGRGDARLVAHP